jgi:hypothetical protein
MGCGESATLRDRGDCCFGRGARSKAVDAVSDSRRVGTSQCGQGNAGALGPVAWVPTGVATCQGARSTFRHLGERGRCWTR